MRNLRQDYRHDFAPEERLHVELTAPDGRPVGGRIVDLCVNGMSVELKDADDAFRRDDVCQAQFAIPHGRHRFALEAYVVHATEGRYGLHFLPLDDPTAHDERDRALWLYLLDEQRRRIRQMRAARATTPA